jgi:hypothetical protein
MRTVVTAQLQFIVVVTRRADGDLTPAHFGAPLCLRPKADVVDAPRPARGSISVLAPSFGRSLACEDAGPLMWKLLRLITPQPTQSFREMRRRPISPGWPWKVLVINPKRSRRLFADHGYASPPRMCVKLPIGSLSWQQRHWLKLRRSGWPVGRVAQGALSDIPARSRIHPKSMRITVAAGVEIQALPPIATEPASHRDVAFCPVGQQWKAMPSLPPSWKDHALHRQPYIVLPVLTRECGSPCSGSNRFGKRQH